jgi:hypothetical protein
MQLNLDIKFDTFFTAPWNQSACLAQMNQLQHPYVPNFAEAQVNTSSQFSQSNYAHYYGF